MSIPVRGRTPQATDTGGFTGVLGVARIVSTEVFTVQDIDAPSLANIDQLSASTAN
jgi:hypothetical protein